MKFLFLLAFAACFFVAAILRADDTRPESLAAEMNNAFAIDAYPHMAEAKGNFVFSPYSAEAALSLLWNGVRGETARQMAQVLHLGADRAVTAENFGALHKRLQEAKSWQLSAANSVWVQQGFSLRPDFSKTAQSDYGAILQQVDFSGAPDAARQTINDRIAQETAGKIENIIPSGMVDASTRLVLADAIYFKAPWSTPFEKANTTTAAFTLEDGQSVHVPLMNTHGFYSYGESKTTQVLDLPYADRSLSMIIFLPKAATGLPALEHALNPSSFRQMMAWVKPQVVNVFLPRFHFSSGFRLADTLQAMGMTDAFSADFAKFSGVADKGLFIGAVQQKAYLAVDEAGTEAAAATVVVNSESGLPASPMMFRADHPFLFVIRHNDTGAILFMGRVVNPSN
jgi:serpin B